LRHGVNVTAAQLMGTAFPFGTLTVNVMGSLLMGLIGGQSGLFDAGALGAAIIAAG